MTTKRNIDIDGGCKVRRNKGHIKWSLVTALLAAGIILSATSAFAQGSIFGTVTNSNASTPANGEISFYGYLDNTDEELRVETSTGAGYDAGFWFDDFQNYLTEAPGNPYDYHFYNIANGEGFVLSKTIPNNSFQQEDIVLAPVSWPAAPGGLNGFALSSSRILLRWNRVAGLTYHIYRRIATSSGSFFRIDDPTGSLANPGVIDSFFVDATSDGVSSYEYVIIAQNGSGILGPHSSILTVSATNVLAPTLASISPTSGVNTGGTVVTIDGSGFDPGGTTVTFGSTPVAGTYVSPYRLTATTPAGTGVVNVTVTNTASGLASNTLVGAFTYIANAAPVLATIGPRSTDEGVNLNFTVIATDDDGTTLTLSTSTRPTGAAFTDNGNNTGTFNWTPTFTQAGTYNVTFYATDGIDTDSEQVVITVNNVNQLPVLATIGPRSVNEGVNLNFNVTATDADGTTLTLSATTPLPTGATFTDNGNNSGTFNWTPTFTQSGMYNVTFYASDGVDTDSEQVVITVNNVNQPPVLAAIGPQLVNENANLNFNVSATDADGVTPTLTTSSPLPTGATFTDNGNGTGTFDWTPDFTQSGIYNVTFYASDGVDTDSEQVTITVNDAGNQAPVLAAIGPRTVAEGANLNFNISATDADLTVPSLSAVNTPVNATFTDNGNGTGTFNFNPDFTQAGIYQVTFIASDGALADSEIVSITVTNVNRPPVLAAIGPRSTTEGANLNFVVSASDPDVTIPALSTSALPPGATFVDNGNGTGTFDWTPDFTQSGLYSVTFYASDSIEIDSEIVSITVNESGNQAPVLNPIGPQTVNEAANLNFTISAIDLDGTIPTLSATGTPTNATFTDNLDGTAVFDFNPDYTQAGVYLVTFKAFDGILVDSEVVSITVLNVNQPPVLAAIGPRSTTENLNLNFVVTATDADNVIPLLTTSALPTGATFTNNGNGTGTFNWTPTFTQSGIYDINFYASDGIDSDSELVTITVTDAGNQPPVLAAIGPRAIAEGAVLSFGVSASDLDGTTPALTAENLPLNATFIDNLNGTGTFNFSPDYTQAGIYLVLFIASDGALADSEQVQITVTELGNQPPTISAVSDASIYEGNTFEVVVTATDPEATPISFSVSTSLTGYNFVDSGNGVAVFTFVSDFFDAGVYDIRFFASDNGLPRLTASDTMTLTVIEVNQPPAIDSVGPFGIRVGRNLTFTVVARDLTSPNPTARIFMSATGLPANASFVDNGNSTGTFSFTPDNTQPGSYTVRFIATDQGVPPLAGFRDVPITVVAENISPVFTLLPQYGITVEGDTLEMLIRAADPDGQPVILRAVIAPPNSSFVDSGNGSGLLTFMPNYVQAGLHQVRFEAYDGIDATRSQPVIIQVADAGNQPPVIDPVPPQTVTEGQTLVTTITATDPDEIGITLSAQDLPTNATFTDNGDGTGTLTFNPSFVQAGTYIVLIIASDGVYLDSINVTLIVEEAGNQPPVITTAFTDTATTEMRLLTFTINATDPDLDTPDLSATGLPTGATFTDNNNGSGVFSWQTDNFDFGNYQVLFFARDAINPALYDSHFVNIVVRDTNLVPTYRTVAGNDLTGIEGDTLIFRFIAVDPDRTTPLVRLNTPTYQLAPNMDTSSYTTADTLWFTCRFIPDYTQGNLNPNFYTVQWIIWDSRFPTAVEYSLAVTPPTQFLVYNGNQPPVIDPIGDRSVIEGNNLTFIVSASDGDGTRPTLSAYNLPANATFSGALPDIKTFSFTPSFAQAGVYQVGFVASDGSKADTELVNITVIEAGNQTPYFTTAPPSAQPVIANQFHSSLLRAVDPDLETLTITASPILSFATFTDSGNGSATYEIVAPPIEVGNSYQVTFIVTDPLGLADTTITTYTIVEFLRGDANSDNFLDLSDMVFLFNYLYKSGRPPASFEAADITFDGIIDIRDPTYLLNYFYKQGPPPPER